jgi:predicted nuclease of predicted toxin-antitoxin system
MRFKLDENLGSRTASLFVASNHDVETVRSENIAGCSDQDLYLRCVEERRCLITLDLDFCDVVRFPPDVASGIAIIRVPRNPTLPVLERLVASLLSAIQNQPIEHRLWIIEPGRIRVHEPEDLLSGDDTT